MESHFGCLDADIGTQRALNMSLNSRTIALVLAASMVFALLAYGEEKKAYTGCAAARDEFFVNEVWAKVGAQACLKCHKDGGDAEDSDFVLQDPERSLGQA